MIHHIDLDRPVGQLIHNGSIKLGGYKKNRIYGLLNCSSGKKMSIENRVFFWDEADALNNGYRPCGNCMKREYENWKNRERVHKR